VEAIRFEHVSKRFRRRALTSNYGTLKGLLAGRWRRSIAKFEALHDVSFSVAAGETFALVGPNGAGKSTILKLAAGIYQEDEGMLSLDGRVGSLIELGLGFHPEFTGRENVVITALLQGMTRAEVESKFDDILAFAGLGDFIDEPVRTYSSGMYMRLGFSIAVHSDPAILLIDEVLAVGDAAFQARCVDRLLQLRAMGTTILMATHRLDVVRDLCTRALWIDRGTIRALGNARDVSAAYEDSVGFDGSGGSR